MQILIFNIRNNSQHFNSDLVRELYLSSLKHHWLYPDVSTGLALLFVWTSFTGPVIVSSLGSDCSIQSDWEQLGRGPYRL